jgi:preprotein translocase subunit SecD
MIVSGGNGGQAMSAEGKSRSTGRIGFPILLFAALIQLSPPRALALAAEQPSPGSFAAVGGMRLEYQVEARAVQADGTAKTVPADPGAVRDAIDVIEHRLQSLGFGDAIVEKLGEDRIVILAPGRVDPQRIIAIVGKTARLSFQMVDDSVSPEDAQAGRLPDGDELLQGVSSRASPEVVKKRVELTGDMLASARLEFDQNYQPVVAFAFNAAGAQRFARFTTDNVGKRFAFVLDGRVVSVPLIMSPITGGEGIIAGGFTTEEASELAVLLNSGTLPVTLKLVDMRSVKPQ